MKKVNYTKEILDNSDRISFWIINSRRLAGNLQRGLFRDIIAEPSAAGGHRGV